MRNRLSVIIAILVCVVFGFLFFSSPQKAQFVPLYTVRNTSDTVVAGACTGNTSGCSLRGAIQAANTVSDSVITFAIPSSDFLCTASGNCRINLSQALPTIVKKVSIRGPGQSRLDVRRSTSNGHRIFTV